MTNRPGPHSPSNRSFYQFSVNVFAKRQNFRVFEVESILVSLYRALTPLEQLTYIMAVSDTYVFPGFLTPVLKQLSFQSHLLIFSHASEVRRR